jgi:hypothetical protein
MRFNRSLPLAVQAAAPKSARMTAFALRLLMLLSLVLMPLGMPATAIAGGAHEAAPAGHCDQQQQSPEPIDMQMHCTACAGLPVLTPAVAEVAARPLAATRESDLPYFRGIELEIATPPPKRV